MFRIVSLMAQEITVCASIKECLITVFFPLSNGKSDRTLWKMFSDSSDNVDNPLFCKISIFSTLQDKCAKSQIIAFLAAAKNGILVQTIPVCCCITFSNTTIEAVVSTIICKLYQTTDINVMPIVFVALFSGKFEKVLGKFRRAILNQFGPLFK